MKKTILTFLMVICSLLSLSQSVAFAKSNRMSFGKKDFSIGLIKYKPFEGIYEVIVVIEDKKVSINSAVQQIYFLGDKSYDLNGCDDGSYWYANDKEGNLCRVYIYSNKFSEIFLSIEYDDFSWVYLLDPIE